jgi:hypothetical protein
VEALEGLKQDFLKRHRKDAHRANQAWESLASKASDLAVDTGLGEAIPRDRWPRRFRDHPNLSRLELVHAHRALYSVYYDAAIDQHKVVIEWIGNHKEYDALFGYSTS